MAKKQPRKPKHVPQRTCIICRTKMDKRRLTRVVRTTPEGEIVIDSTGKRNGRGAYLCDNRTCWQHSIERNMLEKALKTELNAADKALILDAMPAAVSAEQTHG